MIAIRLDNVGLPNDLQNGSHLDLVSISLDNVGLPGGQLNECR